jgi:hypothetical protein
MGPPEDVTPPPLVELLDDAREVTPPVLLEDDDTREVTPPVLLDDVRFPPPPPQGKHAPHLEPS